MHDKTTAPKILVCVPTKLQPVKHVGEFINRKQVMFLYHTHCLLAARNGL